MDQQKDKSIIKASSGKCYGASSAVDAKLFS